MQRTGIAVQLGGKRQAHPAPGLQVADLAVRQRFDGARLHPGIGRLRQRGAAHKQRHQQWQASHGYSLTKRIGGEN
jgi:hypothetical protein